jgi:hypothetical protein
MRRSFNYLAVICFSLLSLSMHKPLRLHRAECPTITIDCWTDLIESNQPFKVSVTVTGADQKLSLSYKWSTSAGTIISGQGTPTITIQNPKPHCQTTTATVEVGGLDASCQNSASCSVNVDPPPVSRKFDEYGAIAFKDEKVRLERFAAQLKKELGGQGYIVFYNRRRASNSQAQRQANRDRMYLININGMDEARIVTVDGGARDETTFELWIAPQGAPAPPNFMIRIPECP